MKAVAINIGGRVFSAEVYKGHRLQERNVLVVFNEKLRRLM